MGLSGLKAKLDSNPKLKKCVHTMMVHPRKARPRAWVRLFMPFYTKIGKGVVKYRSSRYDIFPFNRFEVGNNTTLEMLSVFNNGVGDILIGDQVHIGINNTIIGPLKIGNGTITGQNVLIVGLDHVFEDVTRGIVEQGVTHNPIEIGEHCMIGAHAVIMASLGKRCVIGAQTVVSKPVPDYSICVGNPARIVKQYNHETEKWEKVPPKAL